MARENAEAKGRRYLVEAQLLVELVNELEVSALCSGDGAVYELGFTAGAWFCTCPALRRCSHLIALGLVVAPSASRPKGPTMPSQHLTAAARSSTSTSSSRPRKASR